MPSPNGLELAAEIRKRDKLATILFLTSYDQYVYSAFEVSAFRYIRKIYLEEEFPRALSDALTCLPEQPTPVFISRSNAGEFKIPLSEISFIQKVNRKLFLNKTDGDVWPIKGTITELAGELEKKGFVKINSGCTVNIAHIGGIIEQILVLEDGTKLPISRLKKKEINRKINDYWKGLV